MREKGANIAVMLKSIKPKSKLGLLLIILVALPLFMLGLLGLYALNSNLASSEAKIRNLADKQVAIITTEISNLVKKLQLSLHDDIEALHGTGEWLERCSIQLNCPIVREKRIDLIVTFDKSGEQIYPSTKATAQLYPERRALINISNSLKIALERLSALDEAQKYAGVWTSFTTPIDLNFLHCWLGKQTITLCSVINRDWLITQLVSKLNSDLSNNKTWQLRLIDSNQKPIWQSSDTTDGLDANFRPLDAPLQFWRLQIWPSETASKYTFPLTLIALTLPLAGLLVAIALTLFRDQKMALAEAENRANFAASVSHELRTPLTNLQLYADLIYEKSKILSDDKSNDISRYSQVIAAESTRLSELVNNALVVAKRKGNASGQRINAIPDDIIHETVSRLKPLLKEQIHQITFDLNSNYEISIDQRALEQILVNLLDNARKYAPRARIKISTNIEDDIFTLSVRDWGPSFKIGQRATLFTPFSEHSGIDGFGLGLSVCQQLAGANAGKVTAERANPGARLKVTLQIKSAIMESENQTPPKIITSKEAV